MNKDEIISNYAKLALERSLEIADLRKENEELKWERGSILTDLREVNERLRRDLNELKGLSMSLVDYNYDGEATHYDETIDEDGEGGKDHIFHTIDKLSKICKVVNEQNTL